jgi:hypothetical protein
MDPDPVQVPMPAAIRRSDPATATILKQPIRIFFLVSILFAVFGSYRLTLDALLNDDASLSHMHESTGTPPLPQLQSALNQNQKDIHIHIHTEKQISIQEAASASHEGETEILSYEKTNTTGNLNLLPRLLVIYFPQYHRDSLNDKNWGDNFTDWNSLKGAPAKNRLGYKIPRPTELGYYDLTDTHTRKRQGELARQYGVDGFIYHHYWFYDPTHPGPNLAAPLLKMLQDGEPNVPFFLNWCATKWINVWMGKAIFQNIPTSKAKAITLQEQYFNASDDMIHDHYLWLSQFFHHNNYIKIENQPVFLVYYYDKHSHHILERLRYFARQDGFDGIYLVVGRSAAPDHIYVPKNLTERVQKIMEKRSQTVDMLPMDIFNQSMTYPYPLEYVTSPFSIPQWCMDGMKQEAASATSRPEITGVITTFDNTPRREYKSSNIYNPGEPDEVVERFNASLHAAVYYHSCCQQEMANDRFVAINAWNEWAEAMSVEPSDVYGRRFLEVIRDVKEQVSSHGCK